MAIHHPSDAPNTLSRRKNLSRQASFLPKRPGIRGIYKNNDVIMTFKCNL